MGLKKGPTRGRPPSTGGFLGGGGSPISRRARPLSAIGGFARNWDDHGAHGPAGGGFLDLEVLCTEAGFDGVVVGCGRIEVGGEGGPAREVTEIIGRELVVIELGGEPVDALDGSGGCAAESQEAFVAGRDPAATPVAG